jgi:hypothetical protein
MELVTVKTFDNYFSANIILARLQQEGIHCYLRDENAATIYPVFTNAIGGIKLDVEINDAATAKGLLKHYEEEYLQAAICPECGANAFYTTERKIKGNFISNLLGRLFPGYNEETEIIYRCRICGYGSRTIPGYIDGIEKTTEN